MTLAELEAELTSAVDRLRPSVVAIERDGAAARDGTDISPARGSGSGVVWERSGLIVTNEHVVREATRLSVSFADGTELTGTPIGSDPLTDVAVLRVPTEQAPAAPRGDSSALRVGQLALAIGHSLGLPGGPTVSTGVVSALNRPLPGTDFVVEGLIQTDAAINPGNSGGPLADLRGSVIGINSAMVPYAQGVGFAVPVNTVSLVVRQLLASGRVIRPWLGIHGVGVDAAVAKRFDIARARGVLVWDALKGGPAERAGLRAGDVVVRVGSSGIRGFHDLVGALAALPVGAVVDLGFVRSGVERSTVVSVEESPPVRRSP
ncbi:MAG TPA: trypsin-like peptidase domain-containing protein [Thermoplasmata archaeon]|nr:trypsin-like peptidase domain-containing protein [Thermoplasmata archaeon]